jgi:hypothetical protein
MDNKVFTHYKFDMNAGMYFQLLAYANDVKLLGDNADTVNKNTETLIDASKEVGL